MLQSYLLIF